MRAHRVEAAIERGGTLVLDGLPFDEGEVLWQHHMGRRGKAQTLSVEEVERYWHEFVGAPLELFRAAPLATADERTILNRIKGSPYESLAIHLSNVDTLAAIAPAKFGDGDIAE